jgi:hypothetical protein
MVKMAASATSVKELNALKQSCNPLNVSHSANSKKNLMLDLKTKMVPSTEQINYMWLIKSIGSYQGQKIVFLLTQKARRFIIRND